MREAEIRITPRSLFTLQQSQARILDFVQLHVIPCACTEYYPLMGDGRGERWVDGGVLYARNR